MPTVFFDPGRDGAGRALEPMMELLTHDAARRGVGSLTVGGGAYPAAGSMGAEPRLPSVPQAVRSDFDFFRRRFMLNRHAAISTAERHFARAAGRWNPSIIHACVRHLGHRG